jgi:hypothetical protein
LQRKLIRFAAAIGGVAFVAAPAGAALAQTAQIESVFQRDRNVSVRERARPAYDALGIRSGAFLLFPRAEATAAYEDNIFAAQTDEESDTIFSFTPSLSADSQWSRHALNGRVRANIFQYADNSTQNNEAYAASMNGRLDVIRGAFLNGGLSYEHLVEPRTSQSSPFSAAEPVEYDQFGAEIGAVREFNRVRLSGDVNYRSYDFSDVVSRAGTPIDQDYRNNSSWEGRVRADYALSPALAFYATTIIHSWAFKEPNPGDVDRDANGYQLAAGADFELSNLMRGQIQAGYMQNKFDDPTIDDITGLGLFGRIEYFPTDLLTVELNAERSVQATGVFGAAGIRHMGVGVQADYELLRNLILTARVDHNSDLYRGFERKDKVWVGTLGANVLINRRVGMNVLYRRYEQSSSGLGAGPEFAVNRIQAGLVLQF